MTDRHIFNDPSGLVLRSLKGLVASHPGLSLIPSQKVVLRAAYERSKVSLISGGGSGHQPGFSDFVGQGLLTAAVSGEVFSSPSVRQVCSAIKAAPGKGTILIVINYTGDCLNFGLACQKARADGIDDVGMIVVADDVAVEQKPGSLVGRRGLSGAMLVCKILGAASENNFTFAQIMSLGEAMTASLVSVAATLDHCHVPGREDFSHLPQNTIELGLGLHNEPGRFVLSPQPSGAELIEKMINLMVSHDDPERSFTTFEPTDEVVLLVSNMGGTSALEVGVVVDETLDQLEKRQIKIVRIHSGHFLTSLNSPGISLSLLNLTNTARKSGHDVKSLLRLLDAPHQTLGWPGSQISAGLSPETESRTRSARLLEDEVKSDSSVSRDDGALHLDAHSMVDMVRRAANAVLKAKTDLTRWDSLVGDGDCGESCVSGASAVLKALEHGVGADGHVVLLLRSITDLIEESMGGTLGAILAIFMAALTAAVRKAAASSKGPVNAAFWGNAACAAIETLHQSTPARVGDRTLMDALIPFAEGLRSNDLDSAIDACKRGAEATAQMEPKLGRSTYISHAKTKGVPDPGAMAILAIVSSMRNNGA